MRLLTVITALAACGDTTPPPSTAHVGNWKLISALLNNAPIVVRDITSQLMLAQDTGTDVTTYAGCTFRVQDFPVVATKTSLDLVYAGARTVSCSPGPTCTAPMVLTLAGQTYPITLACPRDAKGFFGAPPSAWVSAPYLYLQMAPGNGLSIQLQYVRF